MLYERMALIRATEKAAYDLFILGLVKGPADIQGRMLIAMAKGERPR